MLLTTNCSWEATRGMVRRLIELASSDGRSFPGPDAVARFSPSTLRNRVRCGYRARSLSRLARRVASGRLDLSVVGGPEPTRRRDPRRDPRGGRLRTLRRGGSPEDFRPPRLSRARLVGPAEVPEPASGAGEEDGRGHRAPLRAPRGLPRAGDVAGADRGVAHGEVKSHGFVVFRFQVDDREPAKDSATFLRGVKASHHPHPLRRSRDEQLEIKNLSFPSRLDLSIFLTPSLRS